MRLSLFILALLLSGALHVAGQTGAEKIQGFRDSRFEVVVAGSLFAMSVEDCDNVILVAVHARHGSLTEPLLSSFARRMRSRLMKDQTVAVFFFVDAASAKRFFETSDSDQDVEVLGAVRGVYTFHGSPPREKSKIFPSGLTETDLEEFGSNQ